jgi:hypothetical protein
MVFEESMKNKKHRKKSLGMTGFCGQEKCKVRIIYEGNIFCLKIPFFVLKNHFYFFVFLLREDIGLSWLGLSIYIVCVLIASVKRSYI